MNANSVCVFDMCISNKTNIAVNRCFLGGLTLQYLTKVTIRRLDLERISKSEVPHASWGCSCSNRRCAEAIRASLTI